MNYEDIPPIWERAQVGDPITDDELDRMLNFFKDLTAKLEVLGPRWSLAAFPARDRLERFEQIKYWREVDDRRQRRLK